MVKNNTGGNKSKKQGRKHVNAGNGEQTQNVRKAIEEGEMYAAVTKIYGGSNCQVMCIDGVSRQCVIRNNFKMRGKRENTLIVGSWILVGIRDWEVRSNGTQKCDLLEVYSHNEKDKLKQIETCNFASINGIGGETNDSVLFSSTLKGEHLLEESGSSSSGEDDSKENNDEHKDIAKAIIVPKKNVLSLKELMKTDGTSSKEKINQQNDWLNMKTDNIMVDDI
jgi:initiation factor 1A